MANAIENWHSGLQDYSDDKIGQAGTFFQTCLNLLRHLIKESAKSRLDERNYQSLRTEAHRFILWGDGLGTEYGALDKVLAESQHLRKTVICLLNDCGTCLISLASQFPTSSYLSDICGEIKLLQDQIESTIVEPQEGITDGKTKPKRETANDLDIIASLMESLFSSDSESSTVSDETEETLADLKRHIDCLLDLAPALEDPAKDLIAGKQMHDLSDQNDISAEVYLFITEIMFRWPFANKVFARRLAEANVKRRERLRAELSRARVSDVEDDEIDDEVLAIPERSRASTRALVKPLSRSAIVTSSSIRTAPSETSLATSFNEEESHITGRRVPQLSEDHEWGSAFICTVCGDTLQDVDSQAVWRKHVFNDLQPYICSYPDCKNGENTFVSQRAWIDHEFTIHRIERHWHCFHCPAEHFLTADMYREHVHRVHEGNDYALLSQDQLYSLVSTSSRVRSQAANEQECPFCLKVVADTVVKFGNHVGQHMREIALAVIPSSAYHISDDDSETHLNEKSGPDEVDDERDLPQIGQLSRLGSSKDWNLPEAYIPTVKSIRVVLNLDRKLFSCIGVNRRNGRCRCRISSQRVDEFLRTLKRFQEPEVLLRIGLSDLEQLASLVLCLNWHQYQAANIAQVWLVEIRSNDQGENQSKSVKIEYEGLFSALGGLSITRPKFLV